MATLGLTRELYFITSTVVDWMDVFTRPVYKQIIVESLRYCQAQKGLDIYAWVLMTNHLHLLAGVSKPDTSISDILRDFKKFTSKSIVKAIQENDRESRLEWLLENTTFIALPATMWERKG